MEKLSLRPFDGDVRKYHQFRDDFISAMSTEGHLSPAQKLQHLLEVLEGTPRSNAEGYGICDAAYWDVLDMLEARYGDNTIIRNILMQDFVDIPPPADERADLTRFLDEAATIKKRLKRSGIDVDNEGLFRMILMGHLPVPLRIKLIQSYGCRGVKKVSCVLEGLRQYLDDVREAEDHAFTWRPCEAAKGSETLDQQEEPCLPRASCENHQPDAPDEVIDEASVTPSIETAANAVNTPSEDGPQERRTCPLCGLLHLATNCFMYPTIQKRLRRVQKLKICLLCLREGHRAVGCPLGTKSSSCKTCGHGQHHRILCKDADDYNHSKALRSPPVRTTTGPSIRPASSDRKRSSRKKYATKLVHAEEQPETPEREPEEEEEELWPPRRPNDEVLQPVLWQPYTRSDDDISMPSSPDHNSDPDPDWEERCHAEASIYVASTSHDAPTTLLECTKVTAANPLNGISRNVVVFFDSGSSRSFLSTAVARDLNLLLSEPISDRVNTFGSELPTTIEGFSTSIVLHSKYRCLPPLAFTACDNIVSSVRTALVEPSDLPKLRRGDLTPSPIQVTPDILINQDLASHFKRRYRPSLPHGFYVVNTIFGPLLGGSGKVPPTVPEAAPSTKATITASVTRRFLRMTDATSSSPPLPWDPHREPSTTHSVGKGTDFAPKSAMTHSVKPDKGAPSDAAHQDFSLPVEKKEPFRSMASTSHCTDRQILSKRTKGPRPPRKQPNPLDHSAPLPPPTIHVALPKELQTQSRIQTSHGYATVRSSRSNVQQNPALTKPRKTRLRRRTTTSGRSVLGINNHKELRRMRQHATPTGPAANSEQEPRAAFRRPVSVSMRASGAFPSTDDHPEGSRSIRAAVIYAERRSA